VESENRSYYHVEKENRSYYHVELERSSLLPRGSREEKLATTWEKKRSS
jgi:hypothetical protein